MSKNEIGIFSGEEEKKPSEEQLKKKPSLLMVEDDIDIKTLLRGFFEEDGWDVTAVRSGEEAIAELAKNEFEVMTCDIGLSGEKTGFDVIDEVKYRIDRPAVLVVSSGVYISLGVFFKKIESEEAKETGIDYFVDKPFDYINLLTTVKQAQVERLERLNNGHKK
ncbi:response regulator [Candidatus Microgenomates bacterium]|nr:MAG: response regulator [Candidatus Microgenomates bacterium]